jgi:TM2 domain-containing membrane protein YozV
MKERAVAILLCFFLGSFGIHKFYLGNSAQGIIYLIFSWTFIPGIFAFFEFLGLCFMSDREFNTRFNIHADPHLLDRSSSYYSPLPAKSSKEVTSTLYDLKKLYEDGIITAEEYEIKRKKMLDNI